ncbi:MAG: hypothetical protein ACYDAO_02650 [Thermoplasmataceae archaeon]
MKNYMGIHAIVPTDRIRAIWDKIYVIGFEAGWKMKTKELSKCKKCGKEFEFPDYSGNQY